jgi:hypothetical protein
VQRSLAELFVRGIAQRVLDRVDRVALDALEVVLFELGLQERVRVELEVIVEIVAMHAASQRAALEVDAHVVAGGERVERRQDLVERACLGRGVGEHLARQEREPFLAGRVVLRADGELQRERDRGIGRYVEQDHGGFLGFGGGGRRARRCASRAQDDERCGADVGRSAHCFERSTPTVRRSACK